MSELAVAVFAAETGSHHIERPRSSRYASFVRGFDERVYAARLAERRGPRLSD